MRAERDLETGNGIWERDLGERDGNMASKDIAESPTRSGTPKESVELRV